MYDPDKYVVIKIDLPEESYFKVFGTWYGGYTTGDSWRMNSGVTRVEETERAYLFYGSSGSCYKCVKGSYGTSAYTAGILHDILSRTNDEVKITLIEEDNIKEAMGELF